MLTTPDENDKHLFIALLHKFGIEYSIHEEQYWNTTIALYPTSSNTLTQGVLFVFNPKGAYLTTGSFPMEGSN
jgi:hypothetical protein